MENRAFPEIKKRLGFGAMRLPMKGEAIDYDQVNEMFDYFIENGFNYFDTAHGYHAGLSELTIRDCLAARHDRSEFLLTDKLTDEYFKSQEEIRPLFEEQLKACGVDYFDFYLMHAQNARVFEYFKEHKAYETALELKDEGKIRHFGISFHDKPHVLDQILTEYPQIEVVQIQFNYLDYDDDSVESRHLYEVCRKHGKPLFIMEPVRGGNLAVMPEDIEAVFDEVRAETGTDYSNASYALRFAAGFEGMEAVLSGMSNMEQVRDNVETMKDLKPLDDREMAAVMKAAEVFRSRLVVPCTSCRYCIEENQCPMNINIPAAMTCLNNKALFDKDQSMFFNFFVLDGHGKPSECIGCGMCESVCPQHIEIRDFLAKAAEAFE